MKRMLDTSLRTEAAGPPGPRLANYLKFLCRPSHYLLQHIAPLTSEGFIPLSGRNGALMVARGQEAVRTFFTDNETFLRADGGIFSLPAGQVWSGMFDTVLTANGPDHRRRRKLTAPAFHGSLMGTYRTVFADTFATSKFADPKAGTFDLVTEYRRIARVNMLVCLLGLPPTLENLHLAGDVSNLLNSMFNPAVILFRSPKALTPYRRWVKRVERTYLTLAGLIERRRLESPSWDALSMLCHAIDETGSQLTTAEIAGELHALFVAGHETTASAMIWSTLTSLSRPDLVPHGLDTILKETQRMLPPVALSLPRRACSDIRLSNSNGAPANAVAFVSPLLEHRNPEVFTDPDRFIPERWVDFRPSPYVFLPFGLGKRRCPGASFADLQVHTTLSLLFEQSRWTLPHTQIGFRTESGIILMPDRPLPVRRSRGQRLERITGPLAMIWQPAG
ncbi:cytochrome P450 [Streptomyces kebangsaanensis]|uniref:Cytochrome P450 n=1 Tax=Streptomyces kebangsaanensis TaxID=864058 RepID=A0ABW6L0K0_9ACTN